MFPVDIVAGGVAAVAETSVVTGASGFGATVCYLFCGQLLTVNNTGDQFSM